MLSQMGNSGGKYIGPACQLVASPHGPHHWPPMCGPRECPPLAIHGAHMGLLFGTLCGTNMDISRGQKVGPTQQLTASSRGSQLMNCKVIRLSFSNHYLRRSPSNYPRYLPGNDNLSIQVSYGYKQTVNAEAWKAYFVMLTWM